MAINFPNNPIDGNIYTYDFIAYTYIKKNSKDGYWAVKTPSTLGVASSEEIDKGLDNAKYTTAQGLEGSSYVKEDSEKGATRLTYSGEERLETYKSGVRITGNLLLDEGILQKDGTPVPTIIKSSSDPIKWYRIWSDGFIQQGGGVFLDASREQQIWYSTPIKSKDASISIVGAVDYLEGVVAKCGDTSYFRVKNPTQRGIYILWTSNGY